MKDIATRHLELVDAVNDAKTPHEHEHAKAVLLGFRDAMAHAGRSGWFLIEADHHTMARFGKERPMCCGELLDWQPTEAQP